MVRCLLADALRAICSNTYAKSKSGWIGGGASLAIWWAGQGRITLYFLNILNIKQIAARFALSLPCCGRLEGDLG